MLDYILEDIDLVLVMSVNPGFGGQSFISSQLRKIEAIRKSIDKLGKPIDLEVDGGIDAETARLAVSAGADALVAGNATFPGGPSAYADNHRRLRGGQKPPAQARSRSTRRSGRRRRSRQTRPAHSWR